ncbi:MAG: tail fiber domain-containing protein [Saprospiraceae bacterium]
MKFFILFILLLFSPFLKIFAQGVSISADGSPSDSSAILDIKSTTQGVLLPRMSSNSRDSIMNPAHGLVVFDTTTNTFYYYTGTLWSDLAERLRVWSTYGNTDTDPAINFIGTTDTFPLRFRLNNIWAGELNAGLRNYFLGDSTGISNTTGIKNVGIGSRVLAKNTVGNWNTAMGSEAMYSNIWGNYNAAFGYSAMDSTIYGSENSAFGTQALRSNYGGSGNTATGVNSLYSNRFGNLNTANGAYSLFYNTTGINNTASGAYSLNNNVNGYWNTAVGFNAMLSNISGYNNTAIGGAALSHDTIGSSNTAVGVSALHWNRNSNFNTALGALALYGHETSDNSTAIGAFALANDISGIENAALGYASLFHNSNGNYNTAVGYASLYANTTGNSNTTVGYTSLFSNTTGYQNTGVGQGALTYLVGGHSNIAIGYSSGIDPGSPNVINTVSIGNEGYLNAANNQAFIGNLSTAWIGGQTTWFTYASDARVKNNVQEDVKGLDFISRLRPVTYNLDISAMRNITGNKDTEDYPGKYDIEKIKQSGFLAQEVEQAAIASGYNFNGFTVPKKDTELYTMSYSLLVVPLVKATQELNAKVAQLSEENVQLKSDMKELIARIESLEKRDNR